MYCPAYKRLNDHKADSTIQSAKAGHSEAAYRLAEHYAALLDWTSSFQWAQVSADAGNAKAVAHLGWLNDRGLVGLPNYAAAIVHYKRAAQASEPDGMLGIAEIFAMGRGVSPDPEKAGEWLAKALDCGAPGAAARLGELLIGGWTGTARVQEGLALYYSAAERGDAEALTELGRLNANGTYVERNYAIAMEWYKKAARAGSAIAMFNIGLMYSSGQGVPTDDLEAMEWYHMGLESYKHARLANEPEALRRLAQAYQWGTGLNKNLEEAILLYTQARDLGDAESSYRLGAIYMTDKQYDAAFSAFEHAAARGHRSAMNEIGRFHGGGLGRSENHSLAYEWHKRAADRGCPYGSYEAADKLRLGQGVQKDEAKAFSLYKLSAELNSSYAAFYTAYCLSSGIGCPQDKSAAKDWYKKAMDLGDTTAPGNLGLMHENGEGGLPVDYGKAMELYRRSADAGNAWAMNRIGELYEEGKGIPTDLNTAFSWFEKSANGGSGDGMYAVGLALQRGRGCSEDSTQAFNWYKKAAEAGKVAAMIKVGRMLNDGEGTFKDVAAARIWLQRAIDSGSISAILTLGLLESREKNYHTAFALFMRDIDAGGTDSLGMLAACYALGDGVEKNPERAAHYFLLAAKNGDDLAKGDLLNSALFEDVIVATKNKLADSGYLKRGIFSRTFDGEVDANYRQALERYVARAG